LRKTRWPKLLIVVDRAMPPSSRHLQLFLDTADSTVNRPCCLPPPVLTTASGGQHQINTASIERLNATSQSPSCGGRCLITLNWGGTGYSVAGEKALR